MVSSWGFKYKTAFVWDKESGSFGHYHNAAAELLLIATRGSCLPDAETKADQVQQFPRIGHSRKPEEWRDLIDQLYKHGPRIELFHRGEAPENWEVWGNESE
jgi:N6-adenosine-specific RNA methylase IME4